MGSFSASGSAFTCYRALRETGASSIVAVGIAFGVDEKKQQIGDILISRNVVLYDEGTVRDDVARAMYVYEYPDTSVPVATPRLVERFEAAGVTAGARPCSVGTLLAGVTRIESRAFRDHLVERVRAVAPQVIGGEMEAPGIAAACAATPSAAWVIVKAISDFATPESRARIAPTRTLAATSAAEFVIDTLRHPEVFRGGLPMSSHYFHTAYVELKHPKLAQWESLRRNQKVDAMRVAIDRQLGPFGYGPATLRVRFLDAAGGVVGRDHVRWDEELDDWLVAQGATAVNPAHETHRTELRLRDRFESLLRQYGDGRFNTALMQHLRGGPFAKHPELAPLFELIQEAPPIKSDPVAERKREVDFIISRVAQELCPKLGYDEPAAEKILVDALALYLKQRFHVSDLPEAPPIPRH